MCMPEIAISNSHSFKTFVVASVQNIQHFFMFVMLFFAKHKRNHLNRNGRLSVATLANKAFNIAIYHFEMLVHCYKRLESPQRK